jgi:O-antigen/teichoic acid export membrane protein
MLRTSGTTARQPQGPSGLAGPPGPLAGPGGRQPLPRGRRPFRWFTPALGLLLGGYLFLNKSFAYLHVPGTPVFVGEMVFGIGLVEATLIRVPWRRLVAQSAILKVLAVFMAACSLRLAVDLPRYRLDAVRDSAIWYYGAFAFLVAAAVIYDPTFTPRLLRWYRRVLPWFLLWAPLAIVLGQMDSFASITVPDSSTPINAFKPGDIAVQVGFAIAFLWLGVGRLEGERRPVRSEMLLVVLGVLTLLVAGTQNRGGLLSGVLMLGIVYLFLPAGRQRRIVLSVVLGLSILLSFAVLLDLRLHGSVRDISVRQVTTNIGSVFGEKDSQLSGTVSWRTGYWEEVLTDLRTTGTWVSGIGFGPILPDRYTVDVGNTNEKEGATPLRNVHNSHLTILARGGVPAFSAWLALWLVFCRQLVRAIRRRARGVGEDPVAALYVLLLAAVPAYLFNAFFDPALEGPHCAIWLFTIVGFAAAYTRVRRAPSRLAATPGLALGAAEAPAALAPPPGAVSTAPPPTQPASPSGSGSQATPKASGRRRILSLAGRAGWGLADQALSSLTNFAVGVFVARELGVAEFGAFGLAFATYLFALNASRGLATDPLVVRFSAASAASLRQATAAATATALAVGTVVGAGCVLAGLLLHGAVGSAFLALGLMLPGLLLQDSWRYAFFAAGKGWAAFLNDLVWALLLGPLLAAVIVSEHVHVQWFVLAWGAAAAVAGLVGAAQGKVLPRPSLVGQWYRTHRDLGLRYLGENMGYSVASQQRLYGLGAIAGLAAVGGLRGAELLLGPVNLVIMGIGSLVAIPEAAKLVNRGDMSRLRRFMIALGAMLAVAVVLWGVVVGVLLDWLGPRLLGETWRAAAALLLPTIAMMALLGVWSAAWTGLRAMGAARRSLRAQLFGASAFLAGALAGAVVAGAAGAAWGSAAGNLVACCVWWRQFGLAIREFQSARSADADATVLSHVQ